MAEPTPTTAGQRLWAAVHDWRPEGDAEPLVWGPTELAILGQACGIADVVATLKPPSSAPTRWCPPRAAALRSTRCSAS